MAGGGGLRVSDTNLPDILGYITGGPRYNANVAQMALAIRPRVVRAGRSFEAVLLVQNASDANVDVTATLQLPEYDAQKKPKRFIAKAARLVIGLRPAEVGYVALPVSCLPDTAISDAYKIGMAIEVKPLTKPQRVRTPEGGGEVAVEYINEEALERINELKRLTFSTARRGLVGSQIEAAFSVLSAQQVGQVVDFKPGWFSLWNMSDHLDDHLLAHQYRDMLLTKVLPRLKREHLYAPLLAATKKFFGGSRFPLEEVESHFITKLLVYVLEMAMPSERNFDGMMDEAYNVNRLLWSAEMSDQAFKLPSWCRGMIRMLDRNPQVASAPIQALSTLLYDELLRDAMRYAFRSITEVTTEALGSEDEIEAYIERAITRVTQDTDALTAAEVYLPILVGGLLVFDRALLKEEKMGDVLEKFSEVLEGRRKSVEEDSTEVLQLAQQMLDRAYQKYTFRA